MGGFIIFESDLDGPEQFSSVNWAARNWVYRCFMDQLIASVQNDSELVEELTMSKYAQSVSVDTLAEEKPRLHARAMDALNYTCDQIIQGKCTLMNGDREMDMETQVGFREEIATLFQMLAAYAGKVARTQADVQQE